MASGAAVSITAGGDACGRPTVPRERLVRRLLDARAVQVALLVAPAGYGKTTLLSQWEARDDRPFAWATVEEGDNDPNALLSAIALALDGVRPVGWDVFETLSSKRSDSGAVAVRRLRRALSSGGPSFVLVVDDVHALTATASRRSLIAMGQALPAGSQLVLSGRGDPGLPLGRLRAQGRSLELRAEQLAMTRSEAAAVLGAAGVRLAPDELLSLQGRAEGWPAGLVLAGLALRSRDGYGAGADGFTGDDRFVADYVREEFLAGLSPDELRFVTRTAVLGRLSGSLCDAVLERKGSAEMLARLARSNVMLVALDRSDGAFRYHELFAEALRAELRRREPSLEAALHRRASDWYEAHGEHELAVDHAIAARDITRAGRLMWNGALRQPGGGHEPRQCNRLSRFTDEELARSPIRALASAAACLTEGDMYEAARWTSLAARAPADGAEVEAGVAIMHAALGQRGLKRMAADATRAEVLLGERSSWHPLCLLFQGVTRHLTGDAARARELLQEGAHRAAGSAPMVQTLCLSQLALLAQLEGDLERAAVLASRSAAQVDRCGLDRCSMVALPVAVSAAVQAERGRSDEAREHLRHALGLFSGITDPSPWYAVECRIVLGRATLSLNGLPEARELLAAAGRALSRMPDSGLLGAWLDDARAEVDRALDATAVEDWALTAAELRVLLHLPSHLSFREIAERLFVSPNTVKTHARGIYRKLGVTSRGSAVELAREAGLVGRGAGEGARP